MDLVNATNTGLLDALSRLTDALERQGATPPPELVDLAGVAAMLGIGERTARRLDTTGRLPRPLKVGKCKRWRIEELRDWLQAGAPPRQRWEQMKPSV